MKLVCPSCESGFLVDATAIGPTGRKVRCGRCGTSWLAMPVEAVLETAPTPSRERVDAGQDQGEEQARASHGHDQAGAAAGLAAVAESPASEARAKPDDTLRGAAGPDRSWPRSRSSRRMPDEAPKRGTSLGGWALFALSVAALVAGVVVGRQHIMNWAPETETLYVMAGLAEEAPIPPLPAVNLRLREVTSGRRQVNGASELVVEGEIFNPTDQPQNVPPLVATLMDPTGIELKRWVFDAETETLPPGGHAAFRTSTPDPPGQGNLNLNFVPQQP